ncbi:LysR family transcriptional regulator [Ancylobacter sp. WKF20]|uniref:LysR family transcriptional regulator n=1 Tax=Ancylobacter sp. WKF20 TaxID=3039801 RepID=UPI00243445BC|nr:LysR family transcriptional regulator [Ancylobacter sp. WKF20]WGD29680.1 LysR family transcriptional regulator [Ancylobacter sp. WKF20]
MDLHQLRCFVAVADELHFGRAARRMDLMPAAFGRHVQLLEESLGTRLFVRTTRSVALTDDGMSLLTDARTLLQAADTMALRFRERVRLNATTLRLGAVDTAAAGLVPMLLHDFRAQRPDVVVELVEDKTIGLLPRLLSGRLDLALIRPPTQLARQIELRHLLRESVVVAVQSDHALAGRACVTVHELADEPLIVPNRRLRPHSHDLTIKLFAQEGLRPIITQVAGEKQTIVGLVAAGLGVALVPRWTSRMGVAGVAYVPLSFSGSEELNVLPLAAAWMGGSRDPIRDEMLQLLSDNLSRYRAEA